MDRVPAGLTGSGLRHPLLARVIHAAEAMDVGDTERARALVDGVLGDAPADGDARERIARVFALALAARLSGNAAAGGNLYLQPVGHRDMLAAFDVLAAETPFTRFGHEAANRAILHAVEDAREVHVLDLGVGLGHQWEALLDALATQNPPPRVHLTGVDLPLDEATPDRRLKEVGEALSAHARRRGVPFTFEGVAEHVEDLDMRPFAPADADTPFVVNAAFALHHVPAADGVTDAERARDAVLARVAALAPRVFTLVEPEVEHNALPFVPRTRASLTHYATVFEALDALLARDRKERAVLEHAFFGREVLNVLAAEGPARIERHEPHPAWRTRLSRQGFEAHPVPVDPEALASRLGVEPPFTVQAGEGALTLAWRGTPLVTASAWRADTS